MPIYTPGKLTLRQTYIEGDRNYSNVSLLLHGNGANGSTTITDNSPSPKTVTAVGSAQISTAQSKFGGSSILLGGTGNNISALDSDDFYLPAGFTIECFMYPLSWGTDVYLMGQFEVPDFAPIVLYFAGAGRPGIAVSADKTTFGLVSNPAGSTIPINTWTHLAWVRNGNKWSVYVDGSERVMSSSNNTIPYNAAAALTIGRHPLTGNQYAFNGYIDEFRITKGIARYTSNFTPPTAPFADAQY